jgi:hypothetical protein
MARQANSQHPAVGFIRQKASYSDDEDTSPVMKGQCLEAVNEDEEMH